MPVLAADRDRRDDWFHLYTLRQRISPAAIVEEAGKFANEVIAPLNRVGDTHGALFKDGAVTMPPGWKEAYRNWAAAGWNGLSAPVEWGGQGAPPYALNAALIEVWSGASRPSGSARC